MNNWHRFSLLALILAGFALRLYRLGAESLWYDETVSVVLARKTVTDLIAHTAGDIHPPGYYLLLHFWERLTHPTLGHGLELLFAWPSLFCGLLMLPLLFKLGSRIHSQQVGLLALFLAAVNPFHIWYSQEVRMYTLGALLGLICLWSLLDYFSIAVRLNVGARLDVDVHLDAENQSSVRMIPLCGYLLAAAAGLYSLYYFAFALIGLNVIAFWFLFGRDGMVQRTKYLLGWLGAQIGVLLLWSPWIPIFWRQATDPPVPPWRAEWTLSQFGSALLESTSALVVGQTASDWLMPIIALVGVAGLLFYMKAAKAYRAVLLLYLLVPVAVIYLITATVTPLYHVRYLFLYAPAFMIILAWWLAWLKQQNRWLAALALVGLLAVNCFGLVRFWTSPQYQVDDHRGAVATLAERWRPSDLILVNAGWAYTVLETYWPTLGDNGDVAVPPPLVDVERLLDVDDPILDDSAFPAAGQAPLLVRTGSVNATENLGWGDPDSDFFAVSEAETVNALATLASCYDRIWHYRIYDTVSDPDGLIRDWLSTNGTLQSEQWISGRDLGMLQLFELSPSMGQELGEPLCEPNFDTWQPVAFGDVLQLRNLATPSMHPLGQMLYVTLEWQPLPELADLEAPLSMSLRLYADVETVVAQQDETPSPQTTLWLEEASRTDWPIRNTLALPVPADLSPGSYSLELIVYSSQDGTPLAVPELDNTIWGQRLRLTRIELFHNRSSK